MIDDINFFSEYGRAFEVIENGRYERFDFECGYGRVQCNFIKRSLETFGFGNYYDIVTPYGYGGDVIIECADGKRELLVTEYKEAFGRFCNANGIISYFARFNPIIGNHADFTACFDSLENIRKVIVVDLEKRPLPDDMKKKSRAKYRRTLSAGASFYSASLADNIDYFVEMYHRNMDILEATDYYYFPKEHFERIAREMGDHSILFFSELNNIICSGSIVLVYGSTAYSYLAWKNSESKNPDMNTAHNIRILLDLQERGYKRLMLGGGRSSDENDPLLLFKKNFTKAPPLDFYVGKKIFDQKIYDELVSLEEMKHGIKASDSFFPKYRAFGTP